MNSHPPACITSVDDAAVVRLQRALEWEASERMPGRCPLLGAMVQIILLSPWLVSIPPGHARSSRLVLRAAVVHVFAPLAASAAPLPKSARTAVVLARGMRRELLDTGVQVLAVDLNAIQLEFADDVDEQLPDVVRQNGGVLALLDTEDQAIARYILQPPSWEAQEGIQDVSRKFRFVMTPSPRWKVFREAAVRYGIDLNHYPACAIFDDAYRRCLKEAIRRRALSEAPGSAGRVSFARLAFNAGSPCGIQVLGVKLARNAAR